MYLSVNYLQKKKQSTFLNHMSCLHFIRNYRILFAHFYEILSIIWIRTLCQENKFVTCSSFFHLFHLNMNQASNAYHYSLQLYNKVRMYKMRSEEIYFPRCV
jgi:hypothetical protein